MKYCNGEWTHSRQFARFRDQLEKISFSSLLKLFRDGMVMYVYAKDNGAGSNYSVPPVVAYMGISGSKIMTYPAVAMPHSAVKFRRLDLEGVSLKPEAFKLPIFADLESRHFTAHGVSAESAFKEASDELSLAIFESNCSEEECQQARKTLQLLAARLRSGSSSGGGGGVPAAAAAAGDDHDNFDRVLWFASRIEGYLAAVDHASWSRGTPHASVTSPFLMHGRGPLYGLFGRLKHIISMAQSLSFLATRFSPHPVFFVGHCWRHGEEWDKLSKGLGKHLVSLKVTKPNGGHVWE